MTTIEHQSLVAQMRELFNDPEVSVDALKEGFDRMLVRAEWAFIALHAWQIRFPTCTYNDKKQKVYAPGDVDSLIG